ncbi:hypothetical protein MBLNU459_g6580t1 [Dothideomycetes sp. NU459]
MAEMQKAPQQFKQPSRKGKKAWRKNVDITQLHSLCADPHISGVVAERPSEELFVLDTAGEDKVKKDFSKKHKPLKAEEIIKQRSAIPAVDSRKRKSADGIASGSSKRSKNGAYVSHKDLQRLKNVAAGGASKDIALNESVSHDPWAAEIAPTQDQTFSFLDQKQPVREPKTLRYAPISLAANGKPFPAVKKPAAGKSYNPDFEAWESHVAAAGEREVEAEKKRLREAQEEADRMEKALAEAARPDPKSDDEYESAWESEWEGIQSEAEDSYLNKKRPERKSQSERNKIKRRKEAEAQLKWEKAMKKRDEQQARVKQIAKSVAKKEEERKLKLAAGDVESDDSDDNEVEVLRRRKLGKHFVPEAPLEVVLADELQDSLRALRPEGNLLKDRFRNLLVNGKIEARKPMQHKKPKREVTEKWSYKDWKLR